MCNSILTGTFTSKFLLFPRTSKAAPDTAQQDFGSDCDILTPSPASTAGTDLGEEDGCFTYYVERGPNVSHHPTWLQPSDRGFPGA